MRTAITSTLTACTLTAVLAIAAPEPAAGGMTTTATRSQHCASWTASGTVRNDTGQAAVLSSREHALATQVVPAGGSVRFSLTLPGRVAEHYSTVVVTSLDYSGGAHPVHGWRFTEDAWMARPASC